jgi:predicted amidohydrolase
VVVVPERATSGYAFVDADEARGLARPASEAVAPWVAAAAATGCIVAGGFTELGGDGRVYNSAALVGGTGLLACYVLIVVVQALRNRAQGVDTAMMFKEIPPD